MYQVPINSASKPDFMAIAGRCLKYGLGVGLSIGTLYGLFTGAIIALMLGLIMGSIIGFVMGIIIGLIGGLMLAIEIYCWRKWLSPRNVNERHLYWLAPITISAFYLSLWYDYIVADPIQRRISSVLFFPNSEIVIFVAGPTVVIGITILLLLPRILAPNPAESTNDPKHVTVL